MTEAATGPRRWTDRGAGLGALLFVLAALLAALAVYSAVCGAYEISLPQLWAALVGRGEPGQEAVLWQVRLPRIAAAIVTGWGLGLCGLALQTLLRNPLASPFTLGFSQAAALGAALAIVCLGAGGGRVVAAMGASEQGAMLAGGPYVVSLAAFGATIAATAVILVLARLKNMSPGAVVLVGVAISSLCTSGVAMAQYFATETEIAAVVFWTFGDVARSSWREIGLLAVPVVGATAYFSAQRWSLNALLAGEDTAAGLGINVTALRVTGTVLAALVIAMATAFHGVIGFLGLLAPHIGRMLTGGNHGPLIICSGLIGALLLVGSDTAGRLILGSGSMPVGVITSFMGAPLFLYLLIKRQDH